MLAARTDLGINARSWFYLSRDRGAHWDGPFGFSGHDIGGAATRTDILPISSQHALFMVTCVKPDGQAGRTLCAESLNGGRSFQAKCRLPYDDESYSIMPSSVRLDDDTVLTVIRPGRGPGRMAGWKHSSRKIWGDHGAHWVYRGRILASAAIPVAYPCCPAHEWRWFTDRVSRRMASE